MLFWPKRGIRAQKNLSFLTQLKRPLERDKRWTRQDEPAPLANCLVSSNPHLNSLQTDMHYSVCTGPGDMWNLDACVQAHMDTEYTCIHSNIFHFHLFHLAIIHLFKWWYCCFMAWGNIIALKRKRVLSTIQNTPKLAWIGKKIDLATLAYQNSSIDCDDSSIEQHKIKSSRCWIIDNM